MLDFEHNYKNTRSSREIQNYFLAKRQILAVYKFLIKIIKLE